jgi:RecA/RadA recombinase
MTFFKDLIAEVQDENTSMASDGLGSAEFGGFIDTGSYMLNAVLSGSIFGGVPDNKVTAFAGESATGKCARGNMQITIYGETATIEAIKRKIK